MYSYIKATWNRDGYKGQNYIYESLSLSTKSTTANLSKTLNTLQLSKDEVKNHAPIEMMYRLAHASKSIKFVDAPVVIKFDKLQQGFSNFSVSSNLNYNILQTDKTLNILSITNIEQSYTATAKTNMFIQQFDTESSNLNKVSLYNTALAITNFNTQDALRSAKQDRWLVRNSLLSENLITNSNAFTQSKKLLGVNFLNSDAATKNVWNSTKLNSLDNHTGTSFISSLQELFSNQPTHTNSLSQLNFTNPSLDNFNFFENSRMWLVKKYFFTNQLKNNLTQASLTASSTIPQNALNSNNYNYTLFLNLYNQNPQNQLSYLTMTIQPLNDNTATASLVGIYDFYVNAGDSDILRANNLSFLNKLTHSTSNEGLKYYTTLAPTGFTDSVPYTLNYIK